MRTPEGWSRANLLLKTLQAPPPTGSLQESVLILLLMRLESIEHAKFRASAQLTIDNEKGIEAFEAYVKTAFPYLESTKKKQQDDVLVQLNKEVKRGAIQIRPVIEQKVRSKLKTRLVKRTTPKTKKEANALYGKLGETVPIQ